MFPRLDPAYIGIPYLDRGRDPAIGIDCWGLCRVFYQREFDIELPSLADLYPSCRDQLAISQLVAAEQGNWRRADGPAWGRLVTMKIQGRPWHAGICIDDRHFIHAWDGIGTCIERLDSPRWARRIEGFWIYGRR